MLLKRFKVAPFFAILCWVVSSCSFAAAKPIDPAAYDHPVRVACVGDSITFGMGTSAGMSYPSQLQALLGTQWEVGNFGVSARTLLRKGDFPWWNEPAFQNAQDFNPDVVIIMLGTNDTKPHNWEHKDEFYSDYSDLVDIFVKLPSKPRIYLCRPCPVPEPGHWGINEANIQLEIPWIDKLAAEKGAGIIDMHAALIDHPEMLPDRVHPNDAGAGLMAAAAYAALVGQSEPPQVNSYFADHMVLQRDAKVPVWGTAADGETIVVEFAGQKVSTQAKDGKWKVFLQPMPANAIPQDMTITGKGSLEIHDVLVGDVWVASGQSNMERQLGPRGGQKEIIGWKEAAAKADYPLIRQFSVPRKFMQEQEVDTQGYWAVCTPANAPNFSAVGFYFARDLQPAVKIPVAIIHTSWGGTPAEAWTSLEALETVPAYAAAAQAIASRQNPDKDRAEDKKRLDQWYAEEDPGTAEAWWSVDTSAEGWNEVNVPQTFTAMGIDDFDGVVWFRKELDLPAGVAGATLHLGQIDDCDAVWVNGILIGETDGWSIHRRYAVLAGILQEGRNVIAVRVLDKRGTGGLVSPPDEMRLELAALSGAKSVALAGTWQERIGTSLPDAAILPVSHSLNQNSPTVLYNAMIHPLLPLPIKGVIWYQGESNNNRAVDYDDLFSTMIQDWRARWNRGDFPFLFVQIAPYKDMTPEIREAQRLTLARVPNTAMAVTVDVGDAQDIHPARKEPVGQRLALAARALAYGEHIEYSGPLYDSMTVEDGRAILKFTHIGGGLMAMDGELRGFEVSGSDGVFVPAKAGIDGDAVIVMSEQVKSPVAVRYGWSNVPDINLFNREGLPASPFSTLSE